MVYIAFTPELANWFWHWLDNLLQGLGIDDISADTLKAREVFEQFKKGVKEYDEQHETAE